MSKNDNLKKLLLLNNYSEKIDKEGKIPCYCNKCGNAWWYGGEKEGNERVSCSNCKYKQPLNDLRLDKE